MKSNKANIILVHGSFHNASCWDLLVPELQELGFLTHVVTLPGNDNNKSAFSINLSDYIHCVVAKIQAINEPVTLLGHSMGGAVISMVGEQYPSLVNHLVYLTAIVPRKQDRMVNMSKGLINVGENKFDKALKFSLKALLKGRIDIDREIARQVFYGKQPQEVQKSIIKKIVLQPFMPFYNKMSWTDEILGQINKSYIECSLDEALPITYQRAYQKYMKFSDIKTLESDHSPFLLMPKKLAKTINDILKLKALDS